LYKVTQTGQSLGQEQNEGDLTIPQFTIHFSSILHGTQDNSRFRQKAKNTYAGEVYQQNSKFISKYVKVLFHLHLFYLRNYYCMGIIYC